MAKITTKGQVTIPKRLRDHLGLKPGSSVEFELAADGRVFLKTPQRAPESRCRSAMREWRSSMR